MDFIFTLFAVVGGLVVIKFLYRWQYGIRKLKYMNKLIKRYNDEIFTFNTEVSIDCLFHGKPSATETIPADIYKWCMSQSIERNIYNFMFFVSH